MTTIAVKDGVMAGDSRIVGGYIHQGNFTKIFKSGEDYVGFAGDVMAGQAFVSWYRRGADRENFPTECQTGNFAALVLSKRGTFYYEDSSMPIKTRKPMAIGSGDVAAMAAMLAGADAKKAVKIASMLDPSTGGRIVTRSL